MKDARAIEMYASPEFFEVGTATSMGKVPKKIQVRDFTSGTIHIIINYDDSSQEDLIYRGDYTVWWAE